MSMVSWFHRFCGVKGFMASCVSWFHGFIGLVVSMVSWLYGFRDVNGVNSFIGFEVSRVS